MKDVRVEWQNETSGGRAACDSRPPADDLVGGVRMADGTGGVPASVEHECPLCGTQGWPSAIRNGEYTSVCGSRWFDGEVVALGVACPVIEHKNDLLEERDTRINELLMELARRDGTLVLLPGGAA